MSAGSQRVNGDSITVSVTDDDGFSNSRMVRSAANTDVADNTGRTEKTCIELGASNDQIQAGHEIGIFPNRVEVRFLVDKDTILRVQVKGVGEM